MRSSYSLVAFATAASTASSPSNYTSMMSGFENASIVSSSNGSAICVEGMVPVYASTTTNKNITVPIPANQTVVTGATNAMLMAGSTFAKTSVSGDASVSGTYSISARLCFPRDAVTSSNSSGSVQILSHGIGFDKSYWDLAPGYSYVDIAAASGYVTFLYDRLGVGLSSHPDNDNDAHQVVQAPLQVSILHSLAQLLRNGTLASTSFSSVIGTGHSFGSAITQAVASQYPSDFDAAVLTGYTLNSAGLPTFTAALDLTIASQNNPVRFSSLGNGYLIANNFIGNQFAFLKAGGFPASNLHLADASKQTVTLGELLTLAGVQAVAKYFTGPVDVVNGESDWPFCMGNCSFGGDLTGMVVPMMYPAAGNGSAAYVVPNTGHGISAHYGSTEAYTQVQEFVRKNGF